jgi:hypothetical protein
MYDFIYELNPSPTRILVILLILTIVVAASMVAPSLIYGYPTA